MIKYLVISDIHLGHANNPTNNIVKNLLKYFEDNHKIFKTLDIIFIAGDIFDKLLVNGSKPFLQSLEWLTILSIYCKNNNIKLRILEGTPGHDWKQASVLNTMLKEINISLDFKYINTLDIEYIADLDLNILYVPDEYKHKASETYIDVVNLLKERNLKQVDIAIMHGQFHYQLPMIELESSHNENNYLNIVKYYINIGHIHTHSVNGRILAQGSFDRLVHGEEEPKGAMLVIVDKTTNHMEFRFIENKYAKIFKTLDYRKSKDDVIIKRLDKDILKLPKDSFVRVLVNINSDIIKSKKSIELKYPDYSIKIETKDKVKTNMDEHKILEIPTIDSFQITEDNIKELLINELNKYELSTYELTLVDSELDECI